MYDMIFYQQNARVTTDEHIQMNNILYSSKN